MENKKDIVKTLLSLLKQTSFGNNVLHMQYITTISGEYVHITCSGDDAPLNTIIIDVTADSGIEIINNVIKALSR